MWKISIFYRTQIDIWWFCQELLAILSSQKSQLASKKLRFRYGEMIHWFITNAEKTRTWRSLSWTNWIDEEDLLCQLSENHCSSLRKFPFYNFPLKMPPTVSVNVIKVKHGRPYPILKKFREIIIQNVSKHTVHRVNLTKYFFFVGLHYTVQCLTSSRANFTKEKFI